MARRTTNPVMRHIAAADKAAGTRTPGADECWCSVPGCEGIVGPKFVIVRGTDRMGLCPKKEVHAALKAADKTGEVNDTIAGLLRLGREDLAAKAKA